MDLICCENECACRAYADPAVLNDDRVLRNLLSEEERFTANISYFECVQRELSPEMRRIVADWMMEVCLHQLIDHQLSYVSCFTFQFIYCTSFLLINYLCSCLCNDGTLDTVTLLVQCTKCLSNFCVISFV